MKGGMGTPEGVFRTTWMYLESPGTLFLASPLILPSHPWPGTEVAIACPPHLLTPGNQRNDSHLRRKGQRFQAHLIPKLSHPPRGDGSQCYLHFYT